MTSTTTPRLYLFDPNLKNAAGHYLGYAGRIADAAQERNMGATIVANVAAMPHLSDFRILPVLELDYWQEMRPAAGEDPFDHLSSSAERLAAALTDVQLREGMNDDDVLFFPYINLAEVMGLARWRRQAGITPRTVLLFRRDLDEQGVDAGVGPRPGATLLKQALADLFASPGNSRIRLFTDSDHLTEEHGQSVRRNFQTAPIPVDPMLARAPERAPNAVPTLLYLGDARTEKGYPTLAAIAHALGDELASGRVRMVIQSNFNVPGGEPGVASARNFLGLQPNVTILRNAIDEEEYNRRLLSADLVLLPYQVDRYVSRTSGILAEAICAGIPAIVPQGTWLADQVRRHGAGVIYNALAPDGAAGAVIEALGSLNALHVRAGERRAAYAHFHRPERLVEFVCGARALQSVDLVADKVG